MGSGLLILLLMFTQVGQYLDTGLTTYMVVQGVLFVAAGSILTYAIDSLIEVALRVSKNVFLPLAFLRASNLGANPLSIVFFFSAGLVIAFWYFPHQFDAAVLNPTAGAEMHGALLFAGGLIFVGSRFISRTVKVIAGVTVGKVMGLYGTFLLLTPLHIYASYPFYEQADAGVALLVWMLILDFAVVPSWLYLYFAKAPARHQVWKCT